MVAPMALEVIAHRRAAFALFVDAVGERHYLVAHQLGLYGQHGEHRPIAVAVISARGELIDYARQKSLELAQLLIVGERAVEQALIISALHGIGDMCGRNERIDIFLRLFERRVKAREPLFHVAESIVAARARADHIAEDARAPRLDLSAHGELVEKAAVAFAHLPAAAQSRVDIKVAHYFSAQNENFPVLFLGLLFAAQKAAQNAQQIARVQPRPGQLIDIRLIIYAEVHHRLEGEILLRAHGKLRIDAVMRVVQKLRDYYLRPLRVYGRDLALADHLDLFVADIIYGHAVQSE